MTKKRIRVALTGAAGQIGYALLFRLASGEVFGGDTEIHLNLLELEPALGALEGVGMELDDCAFGLLKTVTRTSDLKVAFKDIDWALLVGSVPRKAGMERKDLLKINGGIFIEQGKALSLFAKPTCKVLVVGNPCNTNALIAKHQAKNIPEENFFAMTMLDQKRAMAQLAQKASVDINDINNLAIWGNHSTTMFPDFFHAMIQGRPATEVIKDESWLKNTFMQTVQKRGAAVIKARGLSSAASAANAIIETIKNLTSPTKKGRFFSVAVSSDGSYDIPKGLMFSFPVRTNGSSFEIVSKIAHNEFAQQKIAETTKELIEEKQAISDLLVN